MANFSCVGHQIIWWVSKMNTLQDMSIAVRSLECSSLWLWLAIIRNTLVPSFLGQLPYQTMTGAPQWSQRGKVRLQWASWRSIKAVLTSSTLPWAFSMSTSRQAPTLWIDFASGRILSNTPKKATAKRCTLTGQCRSARSAFWHGKSMHFRWEIIQHRSSLE